MPHRDQEIAMMRREVELLMGERQLLLQIVGAAAAMIAAVDTQRLQLGAVEAADLVATRINELPEETLHDALRSVHAEIEPGSPDDTHED